MVDAAGAGEQAITNALNGSKSLFRRYSYGKLDLSWDIADAANAYPGGKDCSFDPRAAIELVDPKIDFSRYQRLVLVLPEHNCGWAGQAQVAPTSYDTDDGVRSLTVAWLVGRTLTAARLTHELGHTFGNRHARSFKCERGALPTAGDSCTTVEYGDARDLMGSGPAGWNAIERELTGWLNPGNVLAPTRAGVYTLEDINRNDRRLKALKIRRDTCADQALWVENDAGKVVVRSSGTFVPGQTAQQYPACARNSIDQYKELVAVLAPGQSVRDPNTGAQIRVVSVEGPFRQGAARRQPTHRLQRASAAPGGAPGGRNRRRGADRQRRRERRGQRHRKGGVLREQPERAAGRRHRGAVHGDGRHAQAAERPVAAAGHRVRSSRRALGRARQRERARADPRHRREHRLGAADYFTRHTDERQQRSTRDGAGRAGR